MKYDRAIFKDTKWWQSLGLLILAYVVPVLFANIVKALVDGARDLSYDKILELLLKHAWVEFSVASVVLVTSRYFLSGIYGDQEGQREADGCFKWITGMVILLILSIGGTTIPAYQEILNISKTTLYYIIPSLIAVVIGVRVSLRLEARP